jgi:predicted metal-dependent phosphoesterase TrpH
MKEILAGGFMSPMSGWAKADLHIHTRLSDGGPSPEQVVDHVVRRTDLSVIAITDHNRIDGSVRVRERAARHGLQVVVGEEVSTADGHLLGVFLQDTIAPGMSMEETIAAVHEQGGLALAAHPFDLISSSLLGRGGRSWTEEELVALQLDGLETLNASLVRHMANARAGLLAQGLGFTSVGGSDAHHLAVIGRAHTLFPGRTAEDLRRAILLGTASAAGQSWRWRQYLSWVSGCFIPRTIRRAYMALRTA